MAEGVEFAVGLLLVILLAARRIDAPTPIRGYTTRACYLSGVGLYALVGALIYAAFYQLAAAMLAIAASSATSPSAAFIALSLSLALPSMPGTCRLDARLRAGIRRMIGFPTQAHRIAAALGGARMNPDPEMERELKSVLALRGYDPVDSWLPAAQPTRELWHGAAKLFLRIRGWEKDGRHDRFLRGESQEFARIRQWFDRLSLKVVRIRDAIDRLGELWVQVDDTTAQESAVSATTDLGACKRQSGETIRRVVSEMLFELREDIGLFNKSLCLFAARGVLATAATARQRRRQFRELGYTLSVERPSTAVLLIWVFAIYFVIFLLMLTLPQWSTGEWSTHRVVDEFVRIARIAAVQVGAVAVAILPKRLFGFANEDLRGRTPWLFVVGAGVCATLLALAINTGVLAVMYRGDDFRDHFARSAPWLFMPFVTASLVAFLVQDSRWSGIASGIRRRAADATVMVIGIAAASNAAFALKSLMPGTSPSGGSGWWIAPLAAVLIGTGIGALVPSACRPPPRQQASSRPAREAIKQAAARASPVLHA